MNPKRKPRSNRQTQSQVTVKEDPLQVVLPGTMSPQERVKQVVTQHASFEGPLPHPEIFRQYGEIIPNAPERMLAVFEADSKHAREIQMAALNAQKGDNRRIHWMAWSLVMSGFLLSGIFAWADKDILAGAILTTTIGAIGYSFLKGEKKP